MGKRSRRHRANHHPMRPSGHTPAARPNHNNLAERVLSGELDTQLPALVEAINRRWKTIQDQRTADAMAKLHVGDRVRINHDVSPQYLHGRCGEIHQIDNDRVVVCLDTPVGRFKSGHVRCPPTAVEQIEPART
jgi:hypothetical protein